jgi:hypothetical protein
MVHRLPEVGCGPSAYSGPSVWRDIGGDNCAKWRVNGFAPGKRQASSRGVAGSAISNLDQIGATLSHLRCQNLVKWSVIDGRHFRVLYPLKENKAQNTHDHDQGQSLG